MTTLSTHVLDAALGVPAAGLAVRLLDADGGVLADATTDADGRIRFEAESAGGAHVLWFGTGPWFDAAGRDTFLPEVVVSFLVDPRAAHLHVALLLSPYSYTTYRGS